MSDDRLRDLLGPSPAPISPGRDGFDQVVERARVRRRNRRTGVTGAVVAAAVVAVVGAQLVGRDPGGVRTSTAAGPRVSVTPSGDSTPKRPSSSPATSTEAPLSTLASTVAPYLGGPVPSGFAPASVTTTGSTVFLLGSAPCATAPCTSVVRDEGGSWRGLHAPKVALDTAGPSTVTASTVTDLRFASPADGWAFGGALWSTHDGAQTWQRVQLGSRVLDLATDGATTFAVVGTHCTTAAGPACATLRLWSTPANTDAWRPATPAVSVSPGDTGSVSLGLHAGVAALGGRLLTRTASGGWAAATSPCPATSGGAASLRAAPAAAASGGGLVAVCLPPGGSGAGQIYLDVYTSGDAGHSWHKVTTTASPLHLSNADVRLTAASPTVLAVASTSPDLGGTLLLSRDGGRTWSAPLTLPDRGARAGWRYVGASSATRLVALTAQPDGNLWESTDAGRTWHAVAPR